MEERRRSIVALNVSAGQYDAWRTHLHKTLTGNVSEEDHEASLSLYFSDPDGNPYEITTYEVEELKAKVRDAA